MCVCVLEAGAAFTERFVRLCRGPYIRGTVCKYLHTALVRRRQHGTHIDRGVATIRRSTPLIGPKR
jgi:hypothetical protein